MNRHAETCVAGNAIVMNSVRIIGQYDVKIGNGVDDVTRPPLLLFEIVSGATRDERYDFRLLRVTLRFKATMDSVFPRNWRDWLVESRN